MNICVYGAASQQIHTDFLQGAHQLGHCLAKAGFGLVFGGEIGRASCRERV